MDKQKKTHILNIMGKLKKAKTTSVDKTVKDQEAKIIQLKLENSKLRHHKSEALEILRYIKDKENKNKVYLNKYIMKIINTLIKRSK